MEQQGGFDQHADGDKEHAAKQVAQADEGFLHGDFLRHFGNNRAEEECTQRQRITGFHGKDREHEEHASDNDRLQLRVGTGLQPAQNSRNKKQTDADQQDHERAQGGELNPQVGRVASFADLHLAGQQGEHDDRDDVLHDRDAEGALGGTFVGELEVADGFRDDGRAGDHEHAGDKQAVQRRPTGQRTQELGEVQHGKGAQGGARQGRQSEPRELRQTEPQADGKHQENQADLGERLDALNVSYQRKRGRVGADDDPGGKEADDDGQAEAFTQGAGETGREQHDGEVLNEKGAVHGS